MQNRDPQDAFFYPTLTPLLESYFYTGSTLFALIIAGF